MSRPGYLVEEHLEIVYLYSLVILFIKFCETVLKVRI
jgi:hypothetical protein